MERFLKKAFLLFALAPLWFVTKSHAFLLDLNGVDVIKDSAELLANAIETFPSHSVAIALIGLLAVTNGIYFLAKGVISIIAYEGEKNMYGKAQGLVGLFLTAIGSTLAIYSVNIAQLIP